MKDEESTVLERLDVSQTLSNAPSLKARLANLEKLLTNLNKNIDMYRKELLTLKSAKESFESVFDAKNADIRKTLSNEIDRIAQELRRHLTHQKGENTRIQMQLGILKTQKTEFQNRLKTIRDRMEQIEREVGDG